MNYRFNLVGKTIIFSIVAVIAYAALSFVFSYIVFKLVKLLGIPESWTEFPFFLVLFITIIFLPKRFFKLNFPTKFQRSALIKAPISKVWDELNPKHGNEYYMSAVDRFEVDPKDSKKFTMFMKKALSSDGSGQEIAVNIEVQECRQFEYLDYIYRHDDNTDELIKPTKRSERVLKETPNGVQVTLIEHLHGMNIFMAMAFLLMHPCADTLKQLKARCEGIPDTSWASKMTRDLQIAANGGHEASNTDAGLIIFTAVTTLIAATIALTWFLMTFAAA